MEAPGVVCTFPPCLDVGLFSVPIALLQRISQVSLNKRLESHDILSRERRTTLNRVAGYDNNAVTASPLLSLPVEIRLQIYDWVYEMTSIQKASPAGYPVPLQCSQSRPYCGLPSSLLRLNRQVYAEAREIPFRHNEFAFESWFSSGLSIASTMVLDVFRPWQRRAMRFAMVEMRGADICGIEGPNAWRALSTEWAEGLRGLRVRIRGSKGTKSPDDSRKGTATRWVVDGLLFRMRALERLDVELVGWSCDSGDMLAWCQELQGSLRDYGCKAVVTCTYDMA